MNLNIYKAAAAASALLLLPGCIDDKYDLSDIDTTTELKVNDLTVPVNLKTILLDQVIDIDESDPDATIKYVTIGDKRYFAIEKGGNFHAEPTSISEVKAPVPEHIQGIEQQIHGTALQPAPAVRKNAPMMAMKYIINEDQTEATYLVGQNGAEKVDEAIQTLEDVKMQDQSSRLEILVTLHSADLVQKAERIEFNDLILTLPKGMKVTSEVGTIDGNILTIPHLEGYGNSAQLRLYSDDINFTQDPKYGPEGIKVVDRQFDYTAHLGVESGSMIVYPSSSYVTLDPSITFNIDYELSAFTVTEFSGKISYESEIADIDPVELGDLPDFLAGDETDVIMENPQIVLNVNNPAGAYNLGCYSGLQIAALRETTTPSIQELPEFSVGYDAGDGPYTIVLAPHPEKAVNLPDLPGTKLVTFPGLSHVLSGDGIPERLQLTLTSSKWPEPRIEGDAKAFPLGRQLQDVDGDYTFFTPLALADGSRIVYEKVQDGWLDDDVKDIAVSSFTVTAQATTDLPCGVQLWVRPINADGNDIPIDNPEEAQASIPANAQNEPFAITMKGDIRNLDGIHFIATAQGFDGQSLRPDQTIKIDDLRVRVTGSYTKEF